MSLPPRLRPAAAYVAAHAMRRYTLTANSDAQVEVLPSVLSVLEAAPGRQSYRHFNKDVEVRRI